MKKSLIRIILPVILLILLCSLVGCTTEIEKPPKAVGINLKGETNITVGEFSEKVNSNKYYLLLKMSDSTTKEVVFKKNYVSEEDLNRLENEVGKHDVTITYGYLITHQTFNVSTKPDTANLVFNVDGNDVYSCKIPVGTLYKDSVEKNYKDESSGMVGYKVDTWYTDPTLTQEYVFNNDVVKGQEVKLYGKSEYFVNSLLTPDLLQEFNYALTTGQKIIIDSQDKLNSYAFFCTFFYLTIPEDQQENPPHNLTLTYLDSVVPEEGKSVGQTILNTAIREVQKVLNFTSLGKLKMSISGTSASGTSAALFLDLDVDKDSLNKNKMTFGKVTLDKQVDFAVKKTYQARSDGFDNFKINRVNTEIEVQNSEQLVYALEMGFKPICKTGSPAENVYNQAKGVLRNICNDDMTDIQKIYAIYNWLIQTVQYDNKAFEESISGRITAEESREYDSWFAEGVFNQGKAVCEGFAKALLIMAKIGNIPCVYVTGNEHAWNKVYVNGNWFVIDATHGNLNFRYQSGESVVSNEVYSYTEFLITDEVKKHKGYSTTNHSDVKAVTTYDFYENCFEDIFNRELVASSDDRIIDFYATDVNDFIDTIKFISEQTTDLTKQFVFELKVNSKAEEITIDSKTKEPKLKLSRKAEEKVREYFGSNIVYSRTELTGLGTIYLFLVEKTDNE